MSNGRTLRFPARHAPLGPIKDSKVQGVHVFRILSTKLLILTLHPPYIGLALFQNKTMSPKISLPMKRRAKWPVASRFRKKQRDEIQVEAKKNLVEVDDTDGQGERNERKERKRRSSKRRPSWERADREKYSSKVQKQQECPSPDPPSSSPRGLPNKEHPELSNPSPLQKLLAKVTPAKRYPRPWEKKDSSQSSKKHCVNSVSLADGSDLLKEDTSKDASMKPSHEVSGAGNPANHDGAVHSSPTEVHGHTAQVVNVSLPYEAHNSRKDGSTCETRQKTRDQLEMIPREPLLQSPPPPAPALLQQSYSKRETKNHESTPSKATRMPAISFKPRSLGDTDDRIQQDIHSSFQILVSSPTDKETTGLEDITTSGDSSVLTPTRQPSTKYVTPSPRARSRRAMIPAGGHLPELATTSDANTATKRRFPRFSSLIISMLVLAMACHGTYKFVVLRGNSGGWKYMDAYRVIDGSNEQEKRSLLVVDETRKGMKQEQDTSTCQLVLAGYRAQIPASLIEECKESSKADKEQERAGQDSGNIVSSPAVEPVEIPRRRALTTTKIRSIISGASSVSQKILSALEENIELKERVETAQMLMTDPQPPAMDVDNRQTTRDDTPQDGARKEDWRTDESKSTAACSSATKKLSSTEVDDHVAPAISRISAVVVTYFRNEDTNKEHALDHQGASSSKEEAIPHKNATVETENFVEKNQDTESASPRTIVAGTGESMNYELVEQEHSDAMKDAAKETTSTLQRISEAFTLWIASQENRKMKQEAATIWRKLYARKGPTSNPEYSDQGRNHLRKNQGTRKRSPKSATRRTRVFSDEGGHSGEKSSIDDTGDDSLERRSTSYGGEIPSSLIQSRLIVWPVSRVFVEPIPLVSCPTKMPIISWDEETRAKGNAPISLHKHSSNLIEWGRHLTVHLVGSLHRLFSWIGRLLVSVYHGHPFNLLVLTLTGLFHRVRACM
jgi:hypothetical protein